MGGRARRRLQRQMMDATNAQIAAYREEQAIQRELLKKQKQEYRNFQFQNPYADLQNYYAGMENVYEDLTVGTQAAEFQMEQGAQQRADIMQSLQGAAGGSGIAGLAQTLANQGAIQARQASVDIMQQQRQNSMMKAQGAMQLQQLEDKGHLLLIWLREVVRLWYNLQKCKDNLHYLVLNTVVWLALMLVFKLLMVIKCQLTVLAHK